MKNILNYSLFIILPILFISAVYLIVSAFNSSLIIHNWNKSSQALIVIWTPVICGLGLLVAIVKTYKDI